jgi:DNA polymerase-3 subunit epsilon
MNRKFKFTLLLGALYLFTVSAILAGLFVVWPGLDERERTFIIEIYRRREGIFFVFAFLLPFVLGLLLDYLFKVYIVPPKALAEGIKLMLTSNPGHRIQASGSFELKELAVAVNQLADAYQAQASDVEARIRDAKSDTEEEKNRLAALMSELTQSVLVCNIEGQILLYNHRARQLLSPNPESGGALIGLGRSIFGVIEKNLIVHALENIGRRLREETAEPVADFVTTANAGQLIRVQMAPVLDREREFTGFVLTLEDITRSIESGTRRDFLLRALTEGIRASLANMRAAVETMLEYPDLDQVKRHRFTRIIGEEAEKLSVQLDHTVHEYADSLKLDWPLENMLGSDLLSVIQRKLEQVLEVSVKTQTTSDSLWLKVDSYSLVQAAVYIMNRLKNEFGVTEITLKLEEANRYAHFDMIWAGKLTEIETLLTWENEPLITAGKGSLLTLKDVAERHGGEIWCQMDKGSQNSYFRLLLPITQPESPLVVKQNIPSRPEYYDFDLFHQPGQTPELDQRRLSELNYTVFDTETTGLNPSDGDEIISIGAVRIVNGHLLQHEAFDQLINPHRSLPKESTLIHGITSQMLKGQPDIIQSLPVFFQFCEDTVLVAHNAAFDMRFLQLKEEITGIRFTHPVLDTLLLSEIIHPNQESHRLEMIAERFGVNVIGRHTALGDAIVTGEIFLKMIPLLAEKGINTLGDARVAALKANSARAKY